VRTFALLRVREDGKKEQSCFLFSKNNMRRQKQNEEQLMRKKEREREAEHSRKSAREEPFLVGKQTVIEGLLNNIWITSEKENNKM